ncbi:MAG: glycine--tRNA ligase subunit beta, partial [bacterium]
MSDVKDFLVEIGTEELPPKALTKLSSSFSNHIESALKAADLSYESVKTYAAPRRLAVLVTGLPTQQADKKVEKRGPAVKAAFDAEGQPTPAAKGFASSCGVTVEQLGRMETPKGEWLFFESIQTGEPTAKLLPEMVSGALNQLPIPKRMRWGESTAEFVRPVHWVLMLFGDDVVESTVLEHTAGRNTYGHRFHHPEAIRIDAPSTYVSQLYETGYVMADFAERKERIRQQVEATAAGLNAEAILDEALLDEVTGLVEWPVTLVGSFEKEFLQVPQEALIYSMQDNQKYFAVVDNLGTLQPHFITVANIESKDPHKVIEGNERVIRPRLADAAFFWDQDRKQPLSKKIDELHKILFQRELGTLFDKMSRVKVVAAAIASRLDASESLAERAAELAKCDLMTNMVVEFPAMQGIAGRYLAEHDGEDKAVAIAIDEQYLPRQAGDRLPSGAISQALALAEKIDTLMGIFGIGQKPTGTKDPFALRRAALGVLRILIEKQLGLDIRELLELSAGLLGNRITADQAVQQCFDYIQERLKAYYHDQGIDTEVIDAVMAQSPTKPLDFDRRVKAVSAFLSLPEAQSLAAANKRIQNILKKAEGAVALEVDEKLLSEPAEQDLHAQV